VVIGYKPLYEWLPTMYTQARKKNAFDAKGRDFKVLKSRKKISSQLKTFAAFLKNDFMVKMTDSLAVYEFYASTFGAENVVVLENGPDSEDGGKGEKKFLADFMCRAILAANTACEQVKKNTN